MLHHTDDPACPLCFKKLMDAHKSLIDWFNEIKPSYPLIHVSWAYRGPQAQEQAFIDGKSKVHFPFSPHNKEPAEALDLFIIDEDGTARWPWYQFEKIASHELTQKYGIEWGGNFKSIKDADHFQLPQEKTS